MTDVLLRFALAAITACALGGVFAGRDALAQSQPAQLLFEPLPVDPAGAPSSRPTGLELRVYHLPDGRRAERYTLGGWVPVGDHHAFSWQLAYAGIETHDALHYGGGAPRWQWTTHLRESHPVRLAVDVAGVLPIGVEDLHPLATKASSLHVRLRAAPVGGHSWRLWVGYWGQRVSPPTQRDRPLAYFPSGSGVDVAWVRWGEGVSAQLWLHQQLGGLRDTTWLEADVDLFAVEDLALRLGAATNLGPEDRRLFDLGWTMGLTWRPRSLDEQ